MALLKRENPDDNTKEIVVSYLAGAPPGETREITFYPVRYGCKLWLSLEAQAGLIEQAPLLHCGPYIGSVLSSLPFNPLLYTDARPSELRDLDIDLLELGRFPQWTMEYDPYPIHVAIPRGTQLKLLTVAMHWGITNYRVPASYRQPLSRMQAVAEAVGTRLLSYRTGGDLSPAYPPPGLTE